MRGGARARAPRTCRLRIQHAHIVCTLRTDPPERQARRLLAQSPAPQARAGLPPGLPRTAQPRTTEVTHLPTRLRSTAARDRRFNAWRSKQRSRRAEARRQLRATRTRDMVMDDAGQPSLRRVGIGGNDSLPHVITRQQIRDRARSHAAAYESHLRIGLTPNAVVAARRQDEPSRGAGADPPRTESRTPHRRPGPHLGQQVPQHTVTTPGD